MSEDSPRVLSIPSDQPACDDRLNFTPYAKTLADILADPGTDTPLTIGVSGGWGQGWGDFVTPELSPRNPCSLSLVPCSLV